MNDLLDNEYVTLVRIDRRSINNGFYVPQNWHTGTVIIEPPPGCGRPFEKRVSIRPEARQLFFDAGIDIDWEALEINVSFTVLLQALKPGHYTIAEVLTSDDMGMITDDFSAGSDEELPF